MERKLYFIAIGCLCLVVLGLSLLWLLAEVLPETPEGETLTADNATYGRVSYIVADKDVPIVKAGFWAMLRE